MRKAEKSPSNREWRFGRTPLVVAAGLTVLMFGWQAFHLYESSQAAAERDSGECPTRAVEAAYSAGERLDYLTEEIEHSLFIWGADADDSPLPELGERFRATEAELSDALDLALGLAKGQVLTAVENLDAAHQPLSEHVEEVLGLVGEGRGEVAAATIAGSRFIGLRSDYAEALNGMWTASRQHLVEQLARERRSEVLSVGIALALFALAVGAWGLFIRQIRLGQVRLREEEQQRRQAEDELRQAQKMDALGLMAGGIAHDFNNLVTAIWGSAASARQQLDSEHPALPSLERIEAASEQANGVIRSLLTFSRRTDSAKRPVEVGSLIDATAKILVPMLPASVELVVDHPDDALLWVDADPTQLQQALMNLAINGRDAMPDGGRLTMRAWFCSTPADGAPKVVIEIADIGEGMTADQQERIFEPFYTTRAPGQGTGLGLSVSHGIVTGHGGQIRVESSPGHGSSFIISLPAIETPVEIPAEGSTSSVSKLSNTATVLVVEDHEHVRAIIADALEATGFEVVQTACGEEFLASFDRIGDSVDLLIADVDIPPPNGIDCITRLRTDGVTVPAIVITGTAAPGLEERLDGLAVVLRKPFKMATLADLAARLVEPSVVTS